MNVVDQDSMLISCLFFAELVTITGFIKLHKIFQAHSIEFPFRYFQIPTTQVKQKSK